MAVEWSVALFTRAPEGVRIDVAPEGQGAFFDLLADHGGGGASVGNDAWSAQVSVEAPTYDLALLAGVDTIEKAAQTAGVPAWPVVAVRAVVAGELDAVLSTPNFPEVVGTTEVTELLGVSRQRLHDLRTAGRFPLPIADLAGGPIWLQSTVDAFLEAWDRKPGRPDKLQSLLLRPGDVTGMWVRPDRQHPSLALVSVVWRDGRQEHLGTCQTAAAEATALRLGLVQDEHSVAGVWERPAYRFRPTEREVVLAGGPHPEWPGPSVQKILAEADQIAEELGPFGTG
jgi:hypothetical protein